MIDSFKNIRLNAIQQFLGVGSSGNDFSRSYVSVTNSAGAEILQVPFRFAKKGSINLAEADTEGYPVLVFEDFTPSFVEDYQNYTGRYVNLIPSTPDPGTVEEIPYPVVLDYRFEVTLAAVKDSDYLDILTWFYRKFPAKNTSKLVFNPITLPDGEVVGDYVGYTLTVQESPRTDGVQEAVFIFTLRIFADMLNIEEKLASTEIATTVSPASPSDEDFDNLLEIGVSVNE